MLKIAYLKQKSQRILTPGWQLYEQEQGCTFVSVPSLCLQMDKAPPPLPPRPGAPSAPPVTQPAPVTTPAAPPPPPPPKPDAAVALIEWMTARSEKKQAQAQAKASKQPKLPPPFDLYDMPTAQRAAGFSVAAKLAQRWLDGEAYNAYGTDTPGSVKEISPYPADKVDLNTVSLSWLRGYPKIERRYQALLLELNSDLARKALHEKFASYLAKQFPHNHELSTKAHSQGDWQRVHRDFQFQLETVGMFDTLTNTLGLTDVTAALANFAFYAAVAKARIHTAVYNQYNTPSGTQHCQKSKVEVTHVWVYAKDSYSFHDAGESSQYLGHWNKQGVIVLPAAVAASVGMKKVGDVASNTDMPYPIQVISQKINAQRVEIDFEGELLRFAVDIGGSLLEKDLYYPIRNRDYREWRAKHQRGGDFLIITEPKLVQLDQPILLDMPEVCQ